MTFLEKLKEDKPKMIIPKDCIGIGCPKQHGYENVDAVCGRSGVDCFKCWNREMPDTEPSCDDV